MTDTAPTPKLPPAWFKHAFWRVHRALCRVSGGRFLWAAGGHMGWGAMRLTTIGRRTGKEREVIVAYLEDGQNVTGLAMNGWDDGHPAWWLNLEAHPDAVIQLPHQPPRSVRARVAVGAERDWLWSRWVAIEPEDVALARSRSVHTPVVVFEPQDAAAA